MSEAQEAKRGSLVIVGTGIEFPAHLTMQAAEEIQNADLVCYNLGAHSLGCEWVEEHAQQTINLYQFYEHGKDRSESYREMVDAMVQPVLDGRRVAGVFYGHPGVFVGPGFQAIKIVRGKGLPAKMLPGVSAVDCMFADLEFDPAVSGLFMVEATDLLIREKALNCTIPNIIWQAGAVGDITFNANGKSDNVNLLRDMLLEVYPPEHKVISYIAATIAVGRPQIQMGTIGSLCEMDINASATLLIPPLKTAPPSRERIEALQRQLRADTSAAAQ